MKNATTQAINRAQEAMEEARCAWRDRVHQGRWTPELETPFGEPLYGSYRAFQAACMQWAELVLKASGY